MINGHGFLAREYIRDCTKLPKVTLCPSFVGPLVTLILILVLTVAHMKQRRRRFNGLGFRV